MLAAIYVTAGCTATHPPAAPQEPAAGLPGETAPASAPAEAAPPAPPAQIELAPNAEPHIALLLPLNSPTLGEAAKVVQQGVAAAMARHPVNLPVRVYACADEDKESVALYQQALRLGARGVIGPLTPAGAARIAAQDSIPVPTLVLNRADVPAAPNLYYFGLVMENEARQAARLASLADMHVASIVMSPAPLSKRLAAAFADEWKKLGGRIAATVVFTGDTDVIESLPPDIGNMVFVAANAETARRFRPFINPLQPVYATSQIFKGNQATLVNYDLREVVFLDMPWLVQQDKASIVRYTRANPPLTVDLERLYALGIDACRLMRIMLAQQTEKALPMDGVTGTIRLNPGHLFDREATLAEFKDGMGLTPEAIDEMRAGKRTAGGEPLPGDPAERK